jgi:Protein of unknown function (DUF3761)
VQARLDLVLLVAVIAGVSASAGASAPPPGATAQCRDGTYSFSQHHSGTCSHHGGVAKWLTASGASGPGSSGSSGAGASTSPNAAPNVGHTVLLARRRRTSGCRLGPNPDRRCSPGAYYGGLTKAVLCSASFHTGGVRDVPESEKFQVEQEYGLKPGHYGHSLEIDHIVSLELGGSNSIANLYPEEASFASGAPGYHAKDRVENAAHAWLCQGKISLRAVQRAIATNWQSLYKRILHTTPTG